MFDFQHGVLVCSRAVAFVAEVVVWASETLPSDPNNVLSILQIDEVRDASVQWTDNW